MRSIFLALALMAAAAGPSRAEDAVLAEATDLAGFVMFGESGAPGMVLVVVRGDSSIVLGYGETEKGNNQKPDGNSLVRLNSITKVFTTEVLASLVAEGKLRLTDTLEHDAGGARTPAFEGRPITLLDLATHSAALPREMGEAPEDSALRAWPTRADRWKWLSHFELPWAPGTIAAYSNVGFDLLADAIETSGGKPYPDLLRERVTGPLGMADTGFAPTPEQCKRLMIGSGLGGAGPCVDTHATDGSGGLYSTANDMARWLRHNMDESNETLALSHAVYRQRQALPAAIGFDEAGPMAGLGLGWVITAADGIHPATIAKSGGGVGFMSYIAFAPGRHVGVFVAVNRADFGMFGKLTEAARGMIADLATR
ncbi:D-alanyl-D-alanine-carboxypeptidase/endopeptidaseAmpH [Methylocella tundrae]|uniref:D-alanyl-D-alanine-carboxypeptidase/endopeptidase AmpH n=1 Tax=Methylocella tundrae TaxID=227605 RepID=A0A8B6M4Z5_METTU|nr:D-alanyl-D-alanine-carboxypeptidase/endopeptidase AmpH [Methylocella tundrae]VTZ49182.1 D-alanyl-D-alanine-carboxypeptidase/endopeptidaseAmpH [Methylocella tundrae]